MLHPEKARLAAQATRALRRLARPAAGFDASRSFRGPIDFAFDNVGTAALRALAHSIHARHLPDWSIDDAMAFAGI